MKDHFPKPEEFFLHVGLYQEFTIPEELDAQISELEFFSDTIDCYCPECEKNSTFRGINIKPKNGGSSQIPELGLLMKNLQMQKSISDRFFSISFVCMRNTSHVMIFYCMIKNHTITKIGQYPSFADLNNHETKKYKKILSNRFIELNKAIGLHSHGIGIGSFVYLRRIIETLVIDAFRINKDVLSISEEEFNKLRMGERIDFLEDYLPKFLSENKVLHSILSKGVHELSEEECIEYFSIVKIGIELILDELIEKQLREQKIKSASKDLQMLKDRI